MRIVTAAVAQWPRVSSAGDTNTIDLWWIARRIEQQIGGTLPVDVPAKALGVLLIDECVERRFINGLVREPPTAQLVAQAWDLTVCAHAQMFGHYRPPVTVAVLLHAWHGCIGMAKSLRVETSDHELYTPEIRRESYAGLRNEWEEELARGNVWVRWGVTLARRLEQRRGSPVIEDWVPTDSPYWE